ISMDDNFRLAPAEPRARNSIEQEPINWFEALQGAPPWLGSMVVHMMVLIFLGLIVVTAKKVSEAPPIQAIYGEGDKLGQQLIEDNSLGPTTEKPDPTL